MEKQVELSRERAFRAERALRYGLRFTVLIADKARIVLSSLPSPPYLVYRDRQDDDETIHDVLPERIHAKDIETVADGRDTLRLESR